MTYARKLLGSVFALSTGLAAITAGCATPALSTEKSTSGIRAAEEVGADKVPQAAMHLMLAKEELEQARKLSASERPEQAKSMLTRSEVDAELAVILSRESTQKQEAADAVEKARKFKRESL